ncbi:hypothetical protein K492DRAFT_178351 [Lichtheimia hyalospora FSU 10163]|nr:hypothetical protein K492DRAFT_178351 [Lichtheimia hyalospora FSU 10163]
MTTREQICKNYMRTAEWDGNISLSRAINGQCGSRMTMRLLSLLLVNWACNMVTLMMVEWYHWLVLFAKMSKRNICLGCYNR